MRIRSTFSATPIRSATPMPWRSRPATPAVRTEAAATAEDAVRAADTIGYPVVLKLYSQTITHKTDVDGVRLNLPDAAAVRAAYAEIETAVAERAGREQFLGVTVQPMV